MGLICHPVTPDRWPDLEALFGQRGACGGCWCMTWRLPRAVFESQKGEGNRKALGRLVKSGHAPGILLYDGTTPIGWCAVAPREQYPALERSRILKPVDDQPVWSVSCLFVAKPYRKRGMSERLLRGAVAFAAERGAAIVEGYPTDPSSELPDPFVWTGTVAAFRKAGFDEVLRRSKSRPIVRARTDQLPKRARAKSRADKGESP
jgi:GNAT superfamily N-acetyltransferase